MNTKFTIGQMAKLHKIPIKTLRYYDEIGLFPPAEVDPSTGYRYYSIDQFEWLDLIYYLKTLGVPLKEIKNQLQSRTLTSFLHMLKKYEEITSEKITELQRIQKQLHHRITELEGTRQDNEERIHIKHFPKRHVIQIKESFTSLYELEQHLRTIQDTVNKASSIMIGKVGLTIAKTHVLKNQFDQYNSLFLLLEFPDEWSEGQEHVTSFVEGSYACLAFRGSHEEAPYYYRKLLAYVQEHGYSIVGDAIERVIVDAFISHDRKDYYTEIQLPVVSVY
ncbi:transcriptional regulator, effector-binding domain/component [Fictibacillus macauensis ZFHKF-1]|uniref:Transcriptional regulator, effector-binding domain/component n=1 Tax=Fictibacillus macauensis ZFHKF-1 TaxID=1196324 RepID=I8UIS8_9BACL|nr:MerR family transcriptional regulator [Fictibacillus macauensis]EIT86738.1 transcriptional regulator, effector-binding domain/component [Fictibacillus macauensis ZFHKF-1]